MHCISVSLNLYTTIMSVPAVLVPNLNDVSPIRRQALSQEVFSDVSASRRSKFTCPLYLINLHVLHPKLSVKSPLLALVFRLCLFIFPVKP
jgi:hypothetical protein